ncbi:hypothetical protein [Parvibium lacunae]|uniref:ATP-grasp domain-containing protein n=1 Tax=Parvibium lacunae TaxID=1888893 RepID=A0A368L0S5_9BURK|nr:hypothetical protein [Parvibium lacunae]RCS57045.1 hypothetical protein DU000_09570 [Parvibium lacunae]
MATFTASGALLTNGDYYGTLAAVRDLGKQGIPIWLADSGATQAAASRYVRHHLPCPDRHQSFSALNQVGDWLIELGQRHPGLVLYPTSDDMAWIMAVRQNDLQAHYRLFQAPERAVFRLLNKASLYQTAAAHGLPAPATYYPDSPDSLNAIAARLTSEAGFPVIVKPKTQIGMRTNVKGLVARDATELITHVQTFLDQHSYQPALLAYAPEIRWPMVQAYLPQAASQTYTVAGFIDRHGDLLGVRASFKVLQQPVQIGIGVAFEGRPVLQRLTHKILKLAHAVGYFGVFETEFIYLAEQDQYLLMDFNPRYYGQMNFEIQRGLALPRMVYAAAYGDQTTLSQLAAQAAQTQLPLITTEITPRLDAPEIRQGDHARQRYCAGWLFRFLLRAQQASGRISAAQRQQWLDWIAESAAQGQAFDAIHDPNDPAPERRDKWLLCKKFLRHPRSSYRQHFL